jgi:hypothetical protein
MERNLLLHSYGLMTNETSEHRTYQEALLLIAPKFGSRQRRSLRNGLEQAVEPIHDDKKLLTQRKWMRHLVGNHI